MLLDPGSKIFENVPDDFTSDFPSLDALASGKFEALMKRSDGKSPPDGAFGRWAAEAFVKALQIATKRRATQVGDLLTATIKNPEFFDSRKGPGGEFVYGLFAKVEFPNTLDPISIVKTLEKAGFAAAMAVIGSIPVVGPIAAAAIAGARRLSQIFAQWIESRSPPTVLPWAEYSRDLDEDIVRQFHDNLAGGVDFTPLFMPPFDPEPWQFARRSNKELLDGIIFAPVRGGKMAWSSGYGVLPNTARVVGQAQSTLDNVGHSSLLDRRVDGQGKQEPTIPYRIQVTQCGDYQPALAQMGLAIWKEIEKPSPMMFRVRPLSLLKAWKDFSDNLYDTGLDSLRDITNQLKVGFPAIFLETFGSQLIEPYIPTQRVSMPWDPGYDSPTEQRRTWQLGLFPNSPRPNPIVHRGLWTDGPVDPGLRSEVAWYEQDLKRKGWGWPYRTEPQQTGKLPFPYGFISPGQLSLGDLSKNATPQGSRAVPWPFQELAKMRFGRLFEQLVEGPVRRLAVEQVLSLHRVFAADVAAGAVDERVLLSAYVRPDPVVDLPRYGAFVNQEQLQKLCRDARTRLLELVASGHPAGRALSLADAATIDPPYAKKLEEALAKAPAWAPADKKGPSDKKGPTPDADPGPDLGEFGLGGNERPPPPPEPDGGIAFGDLLPPPSIPTSPLKRGLAVAGGGLLAYLLTR